MTIQEHIDAISALLGNYSWCISDGVLVVELKDAKPAVGEVETEAPDKLQVYKWVAECGYEVECHWWRTGEGNWVHSNSRDCIRQNELFTLEDPNNRKLTEPLEVNEWPEAAT